MSEIARAEGSDVDTKDVHEHLRHVSRSDCRIVQSEVVLVVDKIAQSGRTYRLTDRAKIDAVSLSELHIESVPPSSALERLKHARCVLPGLRAAPSAGAVVSADPSISGYPETGLPPNGRLLRLQLDCPQHADEALIRVCGRSRPSVEIAGTFSRVIGGRHD